MPVLTKVLVCWCLLSASLRGYDSWQLHTPTLSPDFVGVVDAVVPNEGVSMDYAVQLTQMSHGHNLVWTRFWDTQAFAPEGPFTHALPSGIEPQSLAFGAGRLVIVGLRGRIISQSLTALSSENTYSDDGWQPSDSGTACDLRKVRFINGRFVAVGDVFRDPQNPAGNRIEICVSLDGVTWKKHRFPATLSSENMTDIAFLPGVTLGTGRWMASVFGPGACLSFPEDFSSITRVNHPLLGYEPHICSGAGVFVITSGNGLFTSTDGATLQQVREEWHGRVAFGGDRFVAFSNAGIIHSTDGSVWVPSASQPSFYYENKWLCGRGSLWLAGDLQRAAYSVPVTRPEITQQPPALTELNLGESTTFTVAVADSSQKRFQWYRSIVDSSPAALVDGARISGARTASLTLTNVTLDDGADYYCLVMDDALSVRSIVARLKVSFSSGGARLTLHGADLHVPTPAVVTSANGVFRAQGNILYEERDGQTLQHPLQSESSEQPYYDEDFKVHVVANDGTCGGHSVFSYYPEAAVWWRTGGRIRLADVLKSYQTPYFETTLSPVLGISEDGLNLSGSNWKLTLPASLTTPPRPKLRITSDVPDDGYLYWSHELRARVPSYTLGYLGESGGSRVLPLTLRNAGLSDLTVSSVALMGADRDFFTLSQQTFPIVLAPGGTVTMQVSYGQVEALGTHTIWFRVESDDPSNPVQVCRVSGERGTSEPVSGLASLVILDGSKVLPLESGLDFGVTNPGRAVTRTITLKNNGSFTLDRVSLELQGSQASAFSISPAPGTITLGPRQSVRMTFTFQPSSLGAHAAGLRVLMEDAELSYIGERRVQLVGHAQPGGAPVVVLGAPRSMIARPVDGQDRILEAYVLSGTAPMKFQWWKNGVKIPGATGLAYDLDFLQLSDAGIYTFTATNAAGVTVTTPQAHVAVALRNYDQGWAYEGKPYAWKVNYALPPGGSMTFKWRTSSGVPFPAGYKGQQTPVLSTASIEFPPPDDDLHCDLVFKTKDNQTLLGDVYFEDTDVAASAQWPPAIALPVSTVAFPVTAQLPPYLPRFISGDLAPFHNHKITYAATGLPPGIVLNTKTGSLTGTPTAARIVNGIVEPYEVTFTARCSLPASVQTRKVRWMVLPLPAELASSFEGGIFGGMTFLDVLPTGTFTGSMVLPGQKYPFKGKLDLSINAAGAVSAAKIVITSAQTKLPPGITLLEFTHEVYPHPLGSAVTYWSVRNGEQEEKLHRCLFSAKLPYPGSRDVIHVGLQGHDPMYYYGDGFATLRISSAGVGTWAGTVSTGQSFTASQRVVHLAYIDENQYWASGWGMGLFSHVVSRLFIHSPPAVLRPDGRIDGPEGTFFGTPLARRHALNGARMSFRLRGAPYLPPAKNQMWPGFASTTGNAELKLLGLDPEFWERKFVFSLSPAGAVKLPVFTATTPKISVTISPSTGRVSGTLTDTVRDPQDLSSPFRWLSRSAAFSGLFIPHPDINKVIGHINLVQYPTPEIPASQTATYSGSMELNPAPAP